MIPYNAEKVQEMDFRGIWRDENDLLVEIIEFNEELGWLGYFRTDRLKELPQYYSKFMGVNTKTGIRLMKRKRGEEKGWD